MSDGDVVMNGSKAAWFFGGAFAVAAAIGLYLYIDGYFSTGTSVEMKLEEPRVEIEGD